MKIRTIAVLQVRKLRVRQNGYERQTKAFASRFAQQRFRAPMTVSSFGCVLSNKVWRCSRVQEKDVFARASVPNSTLGPASASGRRCISGRSRLRAVYIRRRELPLCRLPINRHLRSVIPSARSSAPRECRFKGLKNPGSSI